MDSVASNYVIRSRQNASVKALRQAFANNGRIDDSRVAIEGEHLLEEAIRSGLIFEQVFVREDSLPHFRSLWNTRSSAALPPLHVLAPDIFDGAVATEAPQGIAAFVRMPIQSLGDVWSVPSPLLLVLEGIQDPGNLGTILRAAEAFGTHAVFALPGTASPWNLKAVLLPAQSSVCRFFPLHLQVSPNFKIIASASAPPSLVTGRPLTKSHGPQVLRSALETKAAA
jgi:TrmH family RNA methyltransferase